MQVPLHGLAVVLKADAAGLQEFLQVSFITAKIAELGGMLKGEFQRLGRAIKAYQPDGGQNIAGGAQHGEDVGGRS